MSIQAIGWVLRQDIARSSEKFVLLCLANYADEMGMCYPSQKTLARDTGQDIKTVKKNIHSLIGVGLLRDTGRKVGMTNSVAVVQIVGLPENSSSHYVYKLTDPETGKFYIGKRSFIGDPLLDTYRGSGRWPAECKQKGIHLIREIISEHETSEEALAAERAKIKEVDDDRLLMNTEAPSVQRKLMKDRAAEWELEVAQKRASIQYEGSPFFPSSKPVFPEKVAQKRATEPSYIRHSKPIDSEIDDWEDPPEQVEKKKKAGSNRTRLPKDFCVTDAHKRWAQEKGYRSPASIFPAFCDFHLAKGSVFSDWDAALRTWVRNDTERFGNNNGSTKTIKEPKEGLIL